MALVLQVNFDLTSISSDSPLLEVNTPRSDEDRLKLMELMVFLMKKGVYDEFRLNVTRLLKFLQANFWNTGVVKRSGDVTRLQALVDKKMIVISEEVVREILQLNDAEGVICLPNDEIFAGLARMGYEKPVGKGFAGVETHLFENMLAVRAIDAEEEVQVPAQDDVVQEHVIEEITTEHVLDKCSALVLRVEGLETAQQLEIIKLKARVKKLERLNKVKSSKLRRLKKVGTSQRIESSDEVENVFNQGRMSVDMETDEGVELVVDQEKDAEIEGRHADTQVEIYNIDLDHSSKVLSMQEDTEVQEDVEVVTTAKLITEVVISVATQVAAASAPIPAAKPAAKPKILKIDAAAPAVSTRRRKGVVIRDPEEELHDDTPAETPSVKDKGKGILIEDPKPMKKKDQIEMDAEYAKKLQEELEKEHEEAYKQIDWNAAFNHVQDKETQYIKSYHGFKKKPQSEFEARKNMISYLKNTEGYKMEFFKGKTYDQILLIFQARFDANMKFLFKTREEMKKEDEEIIKSINETPAQKVTKRIKLSEEAQEANDLRRRLEIVLEKMMMCLLKVFHLLKRLLLWITSFTTLLKNFDREDLETLWRIVKDRFSTKKPTNFSDEYLLLTLKTMFGELDEQDAIWRNQKSVHGLALVKRWKLLTSCGVHVIILSTVQLFLLVERRYSLSRFTLEQLVNVARLQVEEESEMSLELLRFTRQQLLEYQQG
uniref:Uncharacterized protein n=1 Tax=Tanacetum cinerariifolium TaxID=118510 RepID=A0A699J7C1_TANCI|nr:hypothetical protein [Tanacetum cinerariifolium]